MLGQHSQALECMKGQEVPLENEIRMRVDNMCNGGMREREPVHCKLVGLINLSAIHLCAGQMEQAKASFD
jgi:hypothetical protein